MKLIILINKINDFFNSFILFFKSYKFWIFCCIFYLFLIFITFISYQSFASLPSPLISSHVEIKTIRQNETIELSCYRKFTVNKNFNGVIHREIINLKNNFRYEIAGFYRKFEIGEWEKNSSILLPSSAANGIYEMNVYLVWRPAFSIRDHYIKISSVKFEICEKEKHCVYENG